MFRLRVLGGFALEDSAGAVVPLAQRRAEAVLAVLAVCGDLGCTRERLMALLWPDGDEARSRHSVRDTLHIIRQSLGKAAIVSRADGLYLDASVVGADVHAFTRAFTTGALPDAVTAYSGTLLDGFHVDGAPDFERWLDGERTRLARQYEEALERLAVEAERSGLWADAVLWWRRLVEHDPSNSRLVLRCAQATYATGDRVNALKALDAHVRWMREEMDLEPVAEVLAEIQRMRRPGEPDIVPDRRLPARIERPQSAGSLAPRDGAVPVGQPVAREAGPAPAAAASSRPRPRWAKWAALAVLAGAVVVLPLIRGRSAASGHANPRTAVAVLPFQSLSTDSAHVFLARGLHDEVVSQLGKIPTLQVVSPSSIPGDRDTAQPLRRIGQDLGVGSVVQATVRVVGARLRVLVQLVDPVSQTHLWSRVYERTLGDALAIETDIARQVVDALVVHYGFITIDFPGATGTYVAGINNVGQIVGGYSTAGNWDHAFIYDGGRFTILDHPGTMPNAYHYWGGTSANALNDSGLVVGGHGKTSILPTGYVYAAGTFTAMPVQDCALATVANGVSNTGMIVGASELRDSTCYPYPSTITFPPLAYLYVRDRFTPLAPPGSIASVAHAANSHGWVVGTYDDRSGTQHGFRFALGHFTTIDVPGCAKTEATGVNDVWQIVGTCSLSDGRRRGFLLSDGAFTMIDVPGATETEVSAINNAGWIVGAYSDAAGRRHGFEKVP